VGRFLGILVFLGVIYFIVKIAVRAALRPAGQRIEPSEPTQGTAQPPTPSKSYAESKAGRSDMVYDEMCKSYISEENAMKLEHGGKTHYFCGGACRQMFLNSQGSGPY